MYKNIKEISGYREMIRGRKSKRSGQMDPFDSPYTDPGGGEVPFFSFPSLFLDFILFSFPVVCILFC